MWTAPTAGHKAYAGIVSRLGGLLIDVLVVALAVVVVGRGLPEMWKLVAGAPPHWLATAFDWGANITPAVYFAGCWRLTGETLGGVLFGTAVRRADGARLGIIRAVLRAVVGILLAPVWLIGLVTVLFDARRRSLLDMLFGTVVRYAGRPGHLP
ncbi:MAG: RDD family protein [Hamadaea sp.]|nr:RDD family protein [Hamadaea sp.]